MGWLAEFFLERLLRTRMVQGAEVNGLFDAGPASTFYGKIGITYAFGLIDKQTKDDLTYVRRIRNGFAHSLEHRPFSDSSICELWANISTKDDYSWLAQEARDRRMAESKANPRAGYVHTVHGLVGRLLIGIKRGEEKKHTNA